LRKRYFMEKILIENIRIPYRRDKNQDNEAEAEAGRQIRQWIGAKPAALHIHKKSIDARRKPNICFVYSVCAELEISASQMEKLEARGIKRFTVPDLSVGAGEEILSNRPVIVGFGPAGMFCGLLLARYGLQPLILERGADVTERTAKTELFHRTGRLDCNSNIQFGAGGAGTFSDGKLTTRIHDPMTASVIQMLLELGAPEDIAWRAKPHIGTDVLVKIVDEADKTIRSLGGEIRYNCCVSHVGEGYVTVDTEKIPYGVLILATGHSARDTYADLLASSFAVEPKPFSVGVRIEHLQAWLDEAMFGDLAGDSTLGAAEYQLSYRRGDRGCYSFCMCPGGEVVAAASEDGGVVTNGMSKRARDGRNANAALCVSVHPEDYGSTPDHAISFQRKLEARAFAAGGWDYSAPFQTVGDFLQEKQGSMPGIVSPTYRGGMVTPADFRSLFPRFVSHMLEEGLLHFNKQIHGFAASHVPLTGVETRTSAPVRILRTEQLTAIGHDTVYPCGEGAGYAGGIVSAAVDGLRVAIQILNRYRHS